MIEQLEAPKQATTQPEPHITKEYDTVRKGWWIWAWSGNRILEPGKFTRQRAIALRIVEDLKRAYSTTVVQES